MDLATGKAALLASLKIQIKDERVLAAMARVPREVFVPPELLSFAYADEPLPIGHNQTISQPLIVAMMSEALLLKGPEKVLEIGTGSGYQTAILAELTSRVITTERIAELSHTAADRLHNLGYTSVDFKVTTDVLGWPDESPYDAIVVTAATPRLPESLFQQLNWGGRIVIPIGNREVQELFQITRLKERRISRSLGGCRFVPLIDKEAWDPSNSN